ncbi:scoloptoxin SSD552-like [Drosophila hydei]|uniref:Scoloptoxin SSD552 n=1 Tax=Drosophila hydei TaxID=7224 RepID=A0A6J1MC08_DROHY|nr:scoloptoxin SSD552 [Drosophila hydei]XP_030078834.1 scoloptoxin SSD552-like [Drosophila hydei]
MCMDYKYQMYFGIRVMLLNLTMRVNQLLALLSLLTFLPWFGCLNIRISDEEHCNIRPCYVMNLVCNNNGSIGECQENAYLVAEKEFREDIEQIFNTLRNSVAGGKEYRNLPMAARMGKMYWDNELAKFARLDVQRCQVSPRPLMCSINFNHIGRLVELYGYHSDNRSSATEETIRSITSSWMAQVPSITRYQTLHLPSEFDDQTALLHSALLLIEYNTRFGCAALSYTSNIYTYMILSCIFGTDTQDGQRLYSWGATPGNKCQHRDTRYSNLCARGEKYSYDITRRSFDALRMSKIK